MLKIICEGEPVHVYVMRSIDGLVKVGIAKNVITRTYGERLEGKIKQIISICYSIKKFDLKTARIYEAALLGLHRKHIINHSEWLNTQWESVVETLDNMLDGETIKIQISEEETQSVLHDEFMKNKGYTRKYLGKRQKTHYLKCENGICKLVRRLSVGEEGIEVCSLPIEEMMDYLTENGYTLIKKL
ncbi:MAG: hypothetical protein K2J32_00925 [Ruminococcus sp.]|nr:hypothetical protein [Ruminococcus sp.]